MDRQLLRLETVTARHAHRCVWCGLDVVAGTTYHREFFKLDLGDRKQPVKIRRWHPECFEAYQSSGQAFFPFVQ